MKIHKYNNFINESSDSLKSEIEKFKATLSEYFRRRNVLIDWGKEAQELKKKSNEEVKLVLTGEGLVGEGRLGTKRTLQDYGKFCGLDFNTGEILSNYQHT